MANNFKLNYTGNQINELLQKTNETDLSIYATKSYVDQEIGNIDIPEIKVDNIISSNSENAISNKVVSQSLVLSNTFIQPTIEATYGGDTWLQTGTNYIRWYGICYNNDQFIACGEHSSIMVIDDKGNIIDQKQQVAGYDDFRGIAYGKGVYVAVGENGTIYTSADLSIWTKTLNLNNSYYTFYDVIFAQDKFIAVGLYGAQASTDGYTWKSIIINSNDAIMSIRYLNNLFIATDVSYAAIYTSLDGINGWTQHIVPFKAQDIAYANGMYVIVGYEGKDIAYSYDLDTWYICDSSMFSTHWNKIIYNKNLFIAAGDTGCVGISIDGIHWKRPTNRGGTAGALFNLIGNEQVNIICGWGAIWTSNTSFSLNGYTITLPIENLVCGTIARIHTISEGNNLTLKVNDFDAKPINGILYNNKNYILSYNGTSWDIENKDFLKQEIILGETIFNNQKEYTCFMIGILKNNSDLKIILPNSEYTLYTQEEGKDIKVITTDTTISVINHTDNTENIIYKIVE